MQTKCWQSGHDHDDGDEGWGWHGRIVDDGTAMYGECTSCGDCAMYDFTAATGGRATCKLHGPNGSYSYSRTATRTATAGNSRRPRHFDDLCDEECWYDDCGDGTPAHCWYIAGQEFYLVAESNGVEFSVGLNDADRNYHPDEGGNVHSNHFFAVDPTEGTKMLHSSTDWGA